MKLLGWSDLASNYLAVLVFADNNVASLSRLLIKDDLFNAYILQSSKGAASYVQSSADSKNI